MTEPKKLSPSDLSVSMAKMSPKQRTRYYNKCMTNPDTPKENLSLLRQYRDQNEGMFASEDQLGSSRRSKGSYTYGKNYSGGYRDRSNGRVYGSDGYSYDNNGNSYNSYGNSYDPRGNGYGNNNGNGYNGNRGSSGRYSRASDYYAAGDRRRRSPKRPISEPRSYEDLAQTVMGLKSDVARTRYFMKVANNPDTPPETLNNLVRFRNANGGIFASDEEAKAAGPVAGNGRRRSGLWKSKDEFDTMSPRKKMFFVGAFKRRDRNKNAKYFLRVLTNPTSAPEDKQAVTEVVNENPSLVFGNTTAGRTPYRPRS